MKLSVYIKGKWKNILPEIATSETPGLVKIGRGLILEKDGTISVPAPISMFPPNVTAPDTFLIGFENTFSFYALPNFEGTSIKEYVCKMEGIDKEKTVPAGENGYGTVSFTIPKTVKENIDLTFTVIAIDTFNNESLPAEITKKTVKVSINAPEISAPLENTFIYPVAGFTVTTNSEFTANGITDTHLTTDWLICSDSEGKNVVVSSLNSTDLKSHTFTSSDLANLTIDTTYYLFCRFNGENIESGNLSDPVSVISKQAYIEAPSIIDPSDSSIYFLVGLTVSTTSEFISIGAQDTHKSTDWIITSDEDGNNVVAQALNSTDLKSHTFPASELTTMVEGSEYYIWCRFNGNIIGNGNLSNPVSVISKTGYVEAPSVVAPANNSEVAFQAGLPISTSAFSTVGPNDTHIKSSYRVTNLDGSVIAEDLNTTDLLYHTIPATKLSSMIGGNQYKVQCRHEGQSLGKSEWGSISTFKTISGIATPMGRVVYRHPTLPGSVVVYNEFGVTKKLFVADAVHRFTKSWSKGNLVVPGLKRWEHTYTFTNSANTIDTFAGAVDKIYNVTDLTPYANQFTDAHFQAALTETLKPVLQTAKEATDLIRAAGADYDLTWTLRYMSKSVGIETQLPNIYQLMVMYAEGDIIDSLDPTLASVDKYYLGMKKPSSGYRFYVGAYYAWSSTEYSDKDANALRYGGNTYHYEKNNTTCGVIPVAEL